MRASTCLPMLLVLAHGSLSHADGKAEAKEHAQSATQLYNVQQYDKAAEEYQLAYILDPLPEYLYAAGQSQRNAGDCDKAIRSYEAYLRTKPSATEEAKTRKNIERCQEAVKNLSAIVEPGTLPQPEDKEPLPTPPAPPPPPEPEVKAAPPPPPLPPGKSYLAGHLMLGAGVIATGIGTYFFLHGRSTIDQHNTAPTYNEFVAGRGDLETAKHQQSVGMAVMAGGIALIGGAIAYYVLHSSSDEEPQVSAAVTADKAVVFFTRAF